MNQIGTVLKIVFPVALVLAAAGLLASCAAPTAVSTPVTPWYELASGAFRTDAGRQFFGIGVAEPMKNSSLQRVNADNRARHEMGMLVDQYSKALAVTATRTGGYALRSLPQDRIQAALPSLVRQVMRRAIVTDHWVDPQSGQMKALCTLDLIHYQEVLAKHSALDPKLRTAMQGHTEMLHDQLSRDLQGNQ